MLKPGKHNVRSRAARLFTCAILSSSSSAVLSLPLAAQSAPDIDWEDHSFTSPSGGEVQAERGWLSVPERHDRPDGPGIHLPVVRLASTGSQPAPVIVFLAGGPGNSGVSMVTGGGSRGAYLLFETLRSYGTVVTFDQRGTGEAQPSLSVAGTFALPNREPIDSPAARRALAGMAASIRGQMRERGVDLDAYNTEQSVADLEALRIALGVERFVLVAHSYGTHLALAYIRSHEQNVERAILGGVNGLDHRWREPAESDRWLERVSRAVESHAPGARLEEQVRRVFKQLEEDPITVELDGDTVLVGKTEIQVLVTIRSGSTGFIRNLPVLFENLERRVGLEQIARSVQQTVRRRGMGTAMTYAMHVASGVSSERRSRIAAQAPGALFGNAINWGIGDDAFVSALGISDLGNTFRAPFRSSVPVLLVSGALDGRTSEADAREVGQQFDEPAYVTAGGVSHDFFFRRDAAALLWQPMGRFLRGESIPDQRLAVPMEFNLP